jgi:hypothetical protein
MYSLQVNTNNFPAPHLCNNKTDNPRCKGWEQFIYAQDKNSPTSSGAGFIQYWLIDYSPMVTNSVGNLVPQVACPFPVATADECGTTGVVDGSWCPSINPKAAYSDCVANATKDVQLPTEPASSLNKFKVTGSAPGGSRSVDQLEVEVVEAPPGTPLGYYVYGDNPFGTDFANNWTEAEFNVFGDGNSTRAVFNTGSVVAVNDGVISGTSNGPSCGVGSFTAETNNLTPVNTSLQIAATPQPALSFEENLPGNNGDMLTCDGGSSGGDTHMTMFNGTRYDFQASGDFVLVQSPDFTVQTRQRAGPPPYHDTAMNKAVATQMGKTRVEIYVQPTQLFIDGEEMELADSSTMILPTGVQVSRSGDIYDITSESGNEVRATLRSAWIDTSVGLGTTGAGKVSGLLGSPGGTPDQLVAATGAVFSKSEALASLNDMYNIYGQSWRVAAGKSLFTVAPVIPAGSAGKLLFAPAGAATAAGENPTQTIYASNLAPADSAHAVSVCKAAGVTNKDLLDDCVLDVTVLKDDSAADAYKTAPVATR